MHAQPMSAVLLTHPAQRLQPRRLDRGGVGAGIAPGQRFSLRRDRLDPEQAPYSGADTTPQPHTLEACADERRTAARSGISLNSV